uniref:Rab-GAP TBC domain-containing protein n=1 Tax=Heterorhabditis bacteriophora TaxID=37862 RepID=A0A1I7WAH1_HETBA
MSPSLYRPVDTIFKLLERFVEDKVSSFINFSLFIVSPLPSFIIFSFFSILSEGMSLATNDIYESTHNFLLALLQILDNTVKSDNYPKLASILKSRLSSINIYSAGLAYFHPVLLFQWIQLMSYCQDGPLKVETFLEQYAFKHGRQLYLLSPLNHDISSQVDFDILQDKITNEYIMKKLRFPDFVKSAFLNHNVYSNPDVYYSLLHLDSQDLYYVYDCVEGGSLGCGTASMFLELFT